MHFLPLAPTLTLDVFLVARLRHHTFLSHAGSYSDRGLPIGSPQRPYGGCAWAPGERFWLFLAAVKKHSLASAELRAAIGYNIV